MPEGTPLKNHAGFWQPPYENIHNLRHNYYEDLRNDYQDSPDWIDIYIEGKPGVVIKGRQIYNNFKRRVHVSEAPLVWTGGIIYVGWDNSGNCPACVLAQIPTAGQVQVLGEYHTDKMGIVDFCKYVISERNRRFPGAEYEEYADPAGETKFSKRNGGFTSNADLMAECGIAVEPSEQNLTARIQSVDQQLARIDGMLIDPSCTRLINGFISGYCYKEIGNSGVFRDKPDKNRFSHVHDSLQYLMCKVFQSNSGVTRDISALMPVRRSSSWMAA
jgi:hypothetical protein